MEQNAKDSEDGPHPGEFDEESFVASRTRWETVVLIAAFLCILTMPRTITTPGLSPILIVISAVVLVFWIFGKD
jgi:hypothetical protein